MKRQLAASLASAGLSAIGLVSLTAIDQAKANPVLHTGNGASQGVSGAGTAGGSLGTAGVMSFSAPTVQSFAYSNGSGLDQIQYSGSQGQSSSFSVGTNNNAAVTSSAQSTMEYGASSKSTVNLAGCTSGCEQTALTNVLGVAESAYNTSARSASWGAAAEASASASWGASYDEYKGKGGTKTESEWKVSYDASYKAAYAASASTASASGVQNTTGAITGSFESNTTGAANAGTTGEMASNSTVSVTGIGAKSTLAAGTGSSFTTDVNRLSSITQTNAMASGNASAGMNLGTNAAASSNASSFSSVFVSQF